MTLDELVAKIQEACPFPQIKREHNEVFFDPWGHGEGLRKAIHDTLKPEIEKLHGRISAAVASEIKANAEALSLRQELERKDAMRQNFEQSYGAKLTGDEFQECLRAFQEWRKKGEKPDGS